MNNYGQRVAVEEQSRWVDALNASPTGRNLLNGSVDVELVFDADPTGTVGVWPDGARAIWPDGSGNIMIGRYLRSTGWCSVQATP